MRAIVLLGYGGPEKLAVQEVSDPVCGPHSVLIDVHAAAINPVDAKMRGGYQRGGVRMPKPAILGMDVSGVVREVGAKVQGYSVGDAVYASPSHRTMSCYAEQVVVAADEIAPKPKNLSHVEAASLPLVGLTAWDAIVGAIGLKSGEHLLVQAGAGGVGTAAIQIGKALGATVSATCSERNVAFLETLGTDRVINYNEQDYGEVAKGCDAVLESIGGDHVPRAVNTVKRGGRVAMISADMPELVGRYGPYLGLLAVGLRIARRIVWAKLACGVSLKMVTRRSSGKNLAELTKLIEAGQLKPIVAQEYAIEEASKAHTAIESGRTRGKLVFNLKA